MHKKKIVKRRVTNTKIGRKNKTIKKTKAKITKEDYEAQGLQCGNVNKNISKDILENTKQVQLGFNDRIVGSKDLAKEIHQDQQSRRDRKQEKQQGGHIEVEEMSMAELQKLLGVQKKEVKDEDFDKKNKALSLDEQWALEKIVKKYKTNFKKAYLDNKVNTFVWSQAQMEKKYDQYIAKYGKFPQL